MSIAFSASKTLVALYLDHPCTTVVKLPLSEPGIKDGNVHICQCYQICQDSYICIFPETSGESN